MLTKKNKFLIVIFFLTISAAYSQSGLYVQGYIVTNNNDTIRGLIKDRSNIKNTNSVKFRSLNSKRAKIYLPDSIKSFGLEDGRTYYSMAIHDASINRPIFIQELLEGRVSLYKAFPMDGIKIYIVKKAQEYFIINRETYKSVFKIHLTECKEIDYYSFEKQEIEYKEKDLKAFIEKYNNCATPNSRMEISINRKVQVKKGVKASFTHNNIFLHDMDINGTNKSHGHYIDYGYDMGVYFNLSGAGRISTQLEAIYSYQSGKRSIVGFWRYSDDYKFSGRYLMKAVQIPVLVRYSIPINSYVKPYVNAGPLFTYIFQNQFNYSDSFGENTITGDFSSFSYLGFSGGSGVYFQPFKNSLEASFEVRYSLNIVRQNNSASNNLSRQGMQFTLGLGF